MIDQKKRQIIKSPLYYIELAITRRWIILISLFLAMVAGITNAIITPRTYRAETAVLVEPKKVSDAYVKTIDNVDSKSRLNNIKQQIESRTNLERIMQKHNLYSGPEHRNMYPEDKLTSLRRRISIQSKISSKGPDSFRISFTDKSPQMAKDVTDSIAAFFIDESIRFRESEAFATTDFLEGRLRVTEQKLQEIEKNITTFKTKYMGELPEQLQTNLRNLDRLQMQMNEKQISLRDAKNRLLQLGNRLTLDILTPAPRPVTTASPIAMPTDLKQLQDMLADYRTRYQEAHPDVVQLKDTIRALEEKKAQSIASVTEPAASQQPLELPSSNPLLLIQGQEIRAEIKILEEDIETIGAQINEYERRVDNAPKREADLLSLNRDYEETKKSYGSLKTRNLEAEIASDLVALQKGETFRTLDPAKVPERPETPDVLKLFALFLVAGLGIGGGIVFALDYLDHSFRKVKHLELFLELPVIATIPVFLTPRQALWKKFNIALSICFLMLNGVLVLFFAALAIKGVDNVIHKLQALSRLLT